MSGEDIKILWNSKAEEVVKLNDLKSQGYSVKDAILKIIDQR